MLRRSEPSSTYHAFGRVANTFTANASYPLYAAHTKDRTRMGISRYGLPMTALHDDPAQRDPYRLLKLALLAEGLHLSAAATEVARSRRLRLPVTARTGVANGLELILPSDVWVNAPINNRSKWTADATDDDESSRLILTNRRTSESTAISVPTEPAWYGKVSSRGTPLDSIGRIRGDRLSIALFNDCIYFAENRACQFCAIREVGRRDRHITRAVDIAELIACASVDPICPIDHVYFVLGNTRHSERGLPIYEELLSDLETAELRSIHLNQTAPRTKSYVHYLKSLGFTELSFNIEFYDTAIAALLTPGKHADIGLEGHLVMLEEAVEVFGAFNVSSCLIVGLEPIQLTISGVAALMERSIVPKLSAFRPLRGTPLEHHSAPSAGFLTRVLAEALELSEQHGVPLGPLCRGCQGLSIV